jgi:RNA polymerase sigma-70 factor (ECF subfamily)
MCRVSHAEELDQPLCPAGDTSTPPPPDLDAAVTAAQHGDEDAFRILYRHTQPRLLRYVRTLVGDDAEDVTSETWLHIAKDITTFTGDSNGFRAWTATIARHRALDHLRHRKRHPTHATATTDLPDLPAPDDTATAALTTISTHSALTLIATLPRHQAEIILLRTVLGLDTTTVATILGKRPGAIRTAAHRALRYLEHLLNNPERPQ